MSARLRAAAKALNEAGWTCYVGTDEPGRYDECADCRRVCDEVAAKVLAAADEIEAALEGPGRGRVIDHGADDEKENT